MARVTMLTPDQLDPELRRRSRADERSSVELGPTRILGHQPEMAAGLHAFSASLKTNRTLPDHLALDGAFHERLRALFTEPQIVELGLNAALFVGVGRLSATWDMADDLPDRFRAPGEVTPWGADDAIVVH